VDVYIHSSLRLHGVMLNYLSTGTTLPFTDQWRLLLNTKMKLDVSLEAGKALTSRVTICFSRKILVHFYYTWDKKLFVIALTVRETISFNIHTHIDI
jgi:hypothetical protein